MAAALAAGLKEEAPEPRTPRQAAMSERLDSYTAERDLFDTVVAGKPPRAPSPTASTRQPGARSSPRNSPQLLPRPSSTTEQPPGARRQSPVSAAPTELTTASLFSRPDAIPAPLSHKELEAMEDIAKVAAGVATPSRMEQMVRWSANVDLLHGMTRAQRATVIENADVRVFAAGAF